MAIGMFDTETPLLPLQDEILERITEVVQRGVYVLGPEVSAFEQEFADYLGVRHVVGVANGTDAITIALRALGVSPDDEVVVPSFTFYASAEAVVTAGARPVFCDVDPGTRNVTADAVRAALTPRTKAIVTVDLFGCPAPTPALRELGVPVLEDAAQAAGASLDGRRAGSLGDAATFSFYPSKTFRASVTAARSPPTTTGSPSWRARSGSTAPGTSRALSTSATTRVWTRCRPRSCGSCCPGSTRGAIAGAPLRRPTSTRASSGT